MDLFGDGHTKNTLLLIIMMCHSRMTLLSEQNPADD